MTVKDLGTYWVCATCLHAEASGIDLRYESDAGLDYDPETNPSPEPVPWGLLENGQHVAMGMGWEDHNEECHVFISQGVDRDDCDCETREYDTQSCDGCGSRLHGTRYAMTVFSD